MIRDGALADVRLEAERILSRAVERGVPLRVLGGVAVLMHAPSAAHSSLQREYRDLDFITLSPASRAVQSLFTDLGYEADREFNTLHGHQRLYFWDRVNQRQADVFLDVVRMCHRLDLRDRLQADEPTIPLADLLLTKLQVYELNQKDFFDVVALLHDHPLGDTDDDTINLSRLVAVLGSDWGFYRTSKQNIERIRVLAAGDGLLEARDASHQLDSILRVVESAPKRLPWRLRALIGERKRWYDLPEEVEHG